jgi:hypothetical protein
MDLQSLLQGQLDFKFIPRRRPGDVDDYDDKQMKWR